MIFRRTIAEQVLSLGTTIASLALVSAPAPGQIAPLRSPGTGLETFVADRWLWNPAWSYYRSRDSELWLHASREAESGGLHSPFAAGSPNVYEYFVEGAQRLGDDEVFRGQFGFRQDFRDELLWIDSRDYALQNPFVLADSSTGQTVYRGIIMTAEYARILNEDFTAGASVTYGVANGVKEVVPKPTSMNRDLAARFGLTFTVASPLRIGAGFRYVDQQEEITFDEEEASLLTETILFKFRGLDKFLRLTKKSEFRKSQLRGYEGSAEGEYTLDEHTMLNARGEMGVHAATVTDGGTSPVDQGYWHTSFSRGTVRATYGDDGTRLTVWGAVAHASHWSKHPLYDVVFMEGSETTVSLGGGYETPLMPGFLTAGIEYSFAHEREEITDHLSAVRVDLSRALHTLGVHSSWLWSEDFSTTLGYTVGFTFTGDDVVDAPGASPFFALRRQELAAWNVRSDTHILQASIGCTRGPFGSIVLRARYFHRSTEASSLWPDPVRDGFRVALSLGLGN